MNNFKNISPVLPSIDIHAEIEFFKTLGFNNVYDSLNYSDKLDYAVLCREDQYIHIQLQFENDMPSKNASQQIKIWVENLNILHNEFEEQGLEINRRDKTPWGTNEFGFYSPSNHAIVFVQDLD